MFKVHTYRSEEKYIYLFKNDMIIYCENLEESVKIGWNE